MLKIIEFIREDHGKIQRMIRLMTKVVTHLETKKMVNKDCLEQMILFLEIFVEGYHRKKEEEILFPQLNMLGISSGLGGVIEELEREHRKCFGFILNMKSALGQWESEPGSKLEFIENMKGFLQITIPHIEKLNKIMDFMEEKSIDAEKEDEMFVRLEELKKGEYSGKQLCDLDRALEDLEEKEKYC